MHLFKLMRNCLICCGLLLSMQPAQAIEKSEIPTPPPLPQVKQRVPSVQKPKKTQAESKGIRVKVFEEQREKAIKKLLPPDIPPTEKSLNFAFIINNNEEYVSLALRYIIEALIAQKAACLCISQPLIHQLVCDVRSLDDVIKSKIDLILPEIDDSSNQKSRKQAFDELRKVIDSYADKDVAEKGLEKIYKIHTICTYLVLHNFEKEWLIYENKHDNQPQVSDVYILIPKEYTKERCGKLEKLDESDLKKLGLLLENLKLVTFNRNNVPQILGNNDKQLFSQETVKNIKSILAPFGDDKRLRLGFLVGHGMPYETIAGLTESDAINLIKGFEKNLNYLHLSTCFGGGVHRGQIQFELQNNPMALSSMIMSIAGVFDEPITMGSIDITSQIPDFNDNATLAMYPFHTQMRFDKFFDGLARYLTNQTEKLHAIYYHLIGGTYLATNAIHLYIPGYGQGFTLEGFDEKNIRILGNVESRVAEIEKKKIYVDGDTKLLIVHPRNIKATIELRLKQTATSEEPDQFPVIRPAIGGQTCIHFTHLECHGIASNPLDLVIKLFMEPGNAANNNIYVSVIYIVDQLTFTHDKNTTFKDLYFKREPKGQTLFFKDSTSKVRKFTYTIMPGHQYSIDSTEKHLSEADIAEYTKELGVYKTLCGFDINEIVRVLTINDLTALNTFFKEQPNLQELKDPDGRTLLHLATLHRSNKEIVAFLLEKGIPIDVKDASGKTALHYAIIEGQKEIVAFLLEKGIPIDAVDASGETALNYATINGQEDVVELLLKKSKTAFLYMRLWHNLYYAVKYHHQPLIQLFVALGTPIYSITKEAASAKEKVFFDDIEKILNWNASEQEVLTILDRYPELLKKRSFCLPKEAVACDLLGRSAKKGWLGVVKKLLDAGIDANAGIKKGEKGSTPLHKAVDESQVSIVEELIKAGADITIKDNNGETARDLARSPVMTALFEKLPK